MIPETDWFTEVCKSSGTAFSLRLGEKLHEEQTPFQRIEIYQTETFGNLMVIDGFVMLTSRDNFIYHEMMSHPVLFSHPAPQRVVIVGGGDCGTLREVLKHDVVNEVWQVDIDERVTRLSERFFPELCESNDDSRVHMHFEDAIDWIRRAETKSLDVIIIDSTDPIGPGEGLFTQDFYSDCYRALSEDGLLVQQSESPLFHTNTIIKPMRTKLLASGFKDVQQLLFPQCSYPSGWWTASMASATREIVFSRQQQAESNRISTRYYNAAIHAACSAQPEFMRKALE